MKQMLFALAAFLALIPSAFAAGPGNVVGTILSVEGQASITGATGAPARASFNMPVHPGDVLKTGEGARLFVQLIDNTELTLGENGQMTIEDYVFNDKDDSKNRAVYTITKGAFLFVDGLLGKKENPDIKVNIPVGSIGIRGTKFWGGMVDGIYGVIVGDGKIEVGNARGSVALTKGQGTTIASVNARPDTPRTWAPDRIQRATATVALANPEEIGKRMQANAQNNEFLRQRHDQLLDLQEKALEQEEDKTKDTDTRRKKDEEEDKAVTPTTTPAPEETKVKDSSVTIGGETFSTTLPDSSGGLTPNVPRADTSTGTIRNVTETPSVQIESETRDNTVKGIKDSVQDTVREPVRDTGDSVKENTGSTVKETVKDTVKGTNSTVKDTVRDTGSTVKSITNTLSK